MKPPAKKNAAPKVPTKTPATPKRAAPTEAEHYAGSLAAHGRIASEEPLAPGQTHLATTGAKGKKVLTRKRFSAF